MSIASRSTNVRATPTGLDQPNRDGAYDRSSNIARLGVDGGEQESLLAEWREPRKQSRREKSRVSMAWGGHWSRYGKYNDFNVYGLFGRDNYHQGESLDRGSSLVL
jgi:hypothetical protein